MAILHSSRNSLLPSIILYTSFQGKANARALSQSYRQTQPVRLKIESSKEGKIQPKPAKIKNGPPLPKPNPQG
jgi:hypothetical protein